MNKGNILRGHTSPETAYLVNDYPYGFRLRCQIKYWLEYKKGKGHRLVSQTSNPKAGNAWNNKPKASTYSTGLCFMYLDEVGHVQWTSLSVYHAGKDFVEFVAKWSSQFNDEDRAAVTALEKLSRKWNPNTWAEWDLQQAAPKSKDFLVASISSNTNSFGLTGVVLVARDGETFEAATCLSTPPPIYQRQVIALPVASPGATLTARYSWVSTTGRTFEIPRSLMRCPADVVAEFWAGK